MMKTRFYITIIFLLGITLTYGQSPSVGTSIQGDFNGDNEKEFAFAVKIKEGVGNPVDGGTPSEFSVNFSNNNIPPLEVGCCDLRLINEGDLNSNGNDDISILQYGMNGNTQMMTTYSLKNGEWEKIIKTFLIPTTGKYLKDEELQNRILKEGDHVYIYQIDPNDVNLKLVKKKTALL